MNIKDFKTRNASEDDIKQTYDKYKNYTHDQLMEELFTMVSKQKQEGSFDKRKLESLLSAVAPNLSEEQQKRLNVLLEMF